MPVAEELQVLIKAEASNAVRQLDKFKTSTQQAEKSVGSLAKSVAQKGVAMAAAYVSYRAITGAIKDAIDAYGKQEQAENLLSASIRMVGGDADSLLPKFRDLASAIQKVTTVGDEDSLAIMRQAYSYGITTDKIEEATKGAIGLSKAFGMDVNMALKAVALAQAGNYDQLARYIPALRTAKDESEKTAIVQRAMADGFNLAKEEAKGSLGQIAQLSNAVGDMKEVFGAMLTESGAPFITWLKDSVIEMTSAISKSYELARAQKMMVEGRYQEMSALQKIDVYQKRIADYQENIAYLTDENNRGMWVQEGLTDSMRKAKAQDLKAAIQNTEEAIKRAKKQITDETLISIEKEKQAEATRKIAEAQKASTDAVKEERKALGEGLDAEDGGPRQVFENWSTYDEMRKKKDEETTAAMIANQQRWVESSMQSVSILSNGLMNLYSMWIGYENQALQQRITNIQEEEDRESELYAGKIERLKALGVDTAEVEKEAQEAKETADAETAQRIDAIRRKIFENEQKAKIAQTVMSGAQAVISTYANAGGWPFGIVPASIMAGISAAQVGMIASQKYQGLATGGTLSSSGGVLVGEQGPELLTLPKAATVTPLGGGHPIYITINGAVGSRQELAVWIQDAITKAQRTGAIV